MATTSIETPVIKTPPPTGKPVKSLADFLDTSDKWHKHHAGIDGGMLSDL